MKNYFFQKRGLIIVFLTLLSFVATSLPSQACAHKSCKSDVCGSHAREQAAKIPPCHEGHKEESCQICFCCVARDYMNDKGQMIEGPSMIRQIKKQSPPLAYERPVFFDELILASSIRPPGEVQEIVDSIFPLYIYYQSFLI